MRSPRLLLVLLACSCLRPAEDRAALDRRVGRAEVQGLRIEVEDGLAAVREIEPARLELWAQAPILQVTLDGQGPLELGIDNCLPGAVLLLDGAPASLAPDVEQDRRCAWNLTLAGKTSLWVGPTDAEQRTPFHFAVLSDIQDDVPNVGDIVSLMNQDPDLRFVVSTGDLVSDGSREELEEFEARLAWADRFLGRWPEHLVRRLDEGEDAGGAHPGGDPPGLGRLYG